MATTSASASPTSAAAAKLFYAPGLGARTPDVFARMAEADCVMVDGTFWTDDEMIAAGLSTKTARDIGHLPQSGPGGMMDWLDELPKTRAQDPHPHQQHQSPSSTKTRHSARN